MSSENTVHLAIELSVSTWLIAYRLQKPRKLDFIALRVAIQRRCWR